MRDREQGGFHWTLDPEGRLDARLGDEKHAYGLAFVIYAGSTVREVTGDDRALAVAREAFDWLDRHAHDARNGGYFEAMRRDGTPILTFDAGAPIARRTDRVGIYYGYKTMNVHIHLLEAVAALSRVDRRPVVLERLRELHEIVRDRIAVEPGALNLYLTPDWRAIPAHDSFGHDVETAYLLVEAAEALGIAEDAKTWRVARSLGRPRARLGLGRRARRVLRQGRVVRQPGLGYEESLVDGSRGPECAVADGSKVRRRPTATRRHSASSGASSSGTCSTPRNPAGSPRRRAKVSSSATAARPTPGRPTITRPAP